MTDSKPILHVLLTDDKLRLAVNTHLSQQFTIHNLSDLSECFLENNQPPVELLLCQYELLGVDSEESLAQLKTSNPALKTLIIGDSCEMMTQISLLKQGARGYFGSVVSLDKLAEALQCVQHGEVWIDRYIISGLVDELVHEPEISPEKLAMIETLSPKELEVAKLVSHGATNKMIANKMSITERTVKGHMTTIFHKVSLPDRLSLAMLFRDLR